MQFFLLFPNSFFFFSLPGISVVFSSAEVLLELAIRMNDRWACDDNWWRMIMRLVKMSGACWVVLCSSFFSLGLFFVGFGNLWSFQWKLRGKRKHSWVSEKEIIFLKKEKSVGFKPVESSLRIAGLLMLLLLLKMHACKIANSEVLDIQAPTLLTRRWGGRRDERRKKEKNFWNKSNRIKFPKYQTLTTSKSSQIKRKRSKTDEKKCCG